MIQHMRAGKIQLTVVERMEVHSLGPSAAHGRPEPSVKLEHNELVQQLLRLLEIYLTEKRSNRCSHEVCKRPPIGSTRNNHHTTLN
jgi:hypothetical protein